MFRVSIPKAVYFTQYKFETAQIPGNFAIFLRRWLGNSRIVKVEQVGFDRLLKLEFDVLKNGEKQPLFLVIELVSPGNVLLLNKEGKIINLLQPQNHGDRILRGGAIYKSFKQSFNLLEASDDKVAELILNSNKETIVKTLAIDLSLSGVYAEEVCKLAGVDKNIKIKELDKKTVKKIVEEIKKLLSKKPKPLSVGEEIFPFELLTKNSEKVKTFETFSEAIDELLGEKEHQEIVSANVKKAKKSLGKIEKVVDKQRGLANGLTKSEKENQEKGELIYKNYQLVKDVLDAVKKARETMTWKEIKTNLKNPLVKKVDENKGEIVLELE